MLLVCGVRGDATSEHTVSFDGALVRFCSASCRRQFTANPQLFLYALARARPWAVTDTLAGRRRAKTAWTDRAV